MKTLVVANQKGGVGKTTLLVHMAHYAAEAGNRVLVIDLDPQCNTTSSLEAFASDIVASVLFGPKSIDLKQKSERSITLIGADSALLNVDRARLDATQAFVDQMRHFADCAQFDLCLIDTAPALGLRMVAAVTAATYVISPIELEAYSTDGIASMLRTIYGIRQKLNPGLQFLGMLPSRVNTHSPAQKVNLVELLKSYSDLVVRMAITQRTSTGESASAKKPVWAIRKTSARDAGQEMKAVLAHIIEKMGGLPNGA
ncbi:MAG: AAA family ATPase [Xanthomonadaceae bacterium]|nr:AAA family ATPase [Xanthomonadaceae bacterium]